MVEFALAEAVQLRRFDNPLAAGALDDLLGVDVERQVVGEPRKSRPRFETTEPRKASFSTRS